jgi:hypothetical protein
MIHLYTAKIKKILRAIEIIWDFLQGAIFSGIDDKLMETADIKVNIP